VGEYEKNAWPIDERKSLVMDEEMKKIMLLRRNYVTL
jgi:hypothetical protein